ncbi:hypothetical protein MMC21_001794 [Puttea exsequens]|nr:hypothetical protein [Puttea exsequens]
MNIPPNSLQLPPAADAGSVTNQETVIAYGGRDAEKISGSELQESEQRATHTGLQVNGIVKHNTGVVQAEAPHNESSLASDLIPVGVEHQTQNLQVDHSVAEPVTTSLAAIVGVTNTLDIPSQDTASLPELDQDQALANADAALATMLPYSDESLEASQQNIAGSAADSTDNQIQAFAKLEFEDGEFYMMTHAVELGRDIKAAHEALKKDLERVEATSSKSSNNRQDDGPLLNNGLSSDSGRVHPERDRQNHRKKVRGKKSKSSGSSSRPVSRKSSIQFASSRVDYNQLAMESLMGHVDFYGFGTGIMPSPDLVPLIPVHPSSGSDHAGSLKSISRKHVRIAFNFATHTFELHILGRNGCFVDGEFYPAGQPVELRSGSELQLGGVWVRFVLPDVPEGATGAELVEDSDLIEGDRADLDMEDSDEHDEDDEDEDEDEEEQGKEAEQDEKESDLGMMKTRAKAKRRTELKTPMAKRKGPGRPPKNGVISKREQALREKQAREDTKSGGKKGKRGLSKDKAERDSKEKKQAEKLQPNGKRKYTKRRRAGGADEQHDIRESTELTESVPPEQSLANIPPKQAKEKKAPKPPRSPSPYVDESQLTPEQLAKPQQSYVVLIHEALSNSKTGPMSLPQIYKAIERKYPFYKFRVQTVGWQSSVRHNLSQHDAFVKIQRDGKGWMWGLDTNISIEKEKKRRATPPPMAQQQYYPQGPPLMHGYGYPGVAPPSTMPNGHMPPAPYGMRPGMPMPYPPPAYGRPPLPLPLVNPQSESTYQSPYQSAPPPATTESKAPSQQLTPSNDYNGPYAPSQPPLAHSTHNYGHQTDLSPNYPQKQQQHSIASAPINGAVANGEFDQNDKEAISKFKSEFINNMEDKGRAEALTASAIAIISDPRSSKNASTEENAIAKQISDVLGALKKKDRHSNPNSDTSPESSKPRPQPSVESQAAEVAAKSALSYSNGAATPPLETEAMETRSGFKRSLEHDDREGNDNEGGPKAKKVAV